MILNDTEIDLSIELLDLNEKVKAFCSEFENEFKCFGNIEKKSKDWYSCQITVSWKYFENRDHVCEIDKKLRPIIDPFVEKLSAKVDVNKKKEIFAGCRVDHSFPKEERKALLLRHELSSYYFADSYKTADELIKMGFFVSLAHFYSELLTGKFRPVKYMNGVLYYEIDDCAKHYKAINQMSTGCKCD